MQSLQNKARFLRLFTSS